MSFDFLKFFAEVENSIKGYINLEELVKTLATALGAGASVLGVLQALQAHLATIITDPTLLSEVQNAVASGISKNWIALSVGVVTLASDLYRRFNHGVTPIIPTPAPTPTPANPNKVNW